MIGQMCETWGLRRIASWRRTAIRTRCGTKGFTP